MIGTSPKDLFIETGTYIGGGIEQALELGYRSIVSIELSEKYYHLASEKFRYHPHVKIIHGDSYKVLPEILKHVNVSATFWLDGHYSGGDTAIGDYNSPLMQELDAISKHHINTHTILIDDMKCWNKVDGVFDKTDLRSNKFDFYDIMNKLKEINKQYKFKYLDAEYQNDILVAHL